MPSPQDPASIEASLRATLQHLSASGTNVVAGPWLGEVGFELLYWIPFLRWAVEVEPELRGRIVAISRGGVDDWYEGIAERYVDVFDVVDADAYAVARDSFKQKQRALTDFERGIIADALHAAEIPTAAVLHPGVMFDAYQALIKHDSGAFHRGVRHTGERCVGVCAVYEPLRASAPPPPIAAALPASYLAMRFYFRRRSFVDDPATRELVDEVARLVASDHDVVLLNPGLELDDHRDAPVEIHPRIHLMPVLSDVRDNLALQASVIGRADAFVGTYGGLAYLGPFLGVDTLAFSMGLGGLQPWHLSLAQAIFADDRYGWLTSLFARDLGVVQLLGQTSRTVTPSTMPA